MDNEKVSFYMNEKNTEWFTAQVSSYFEANGTTYGATSNIINDAITSYSCSSGDNMEVEG